MSSCPTAPVAPTMPILYFLFMDDLSKKIINVCNELKVCPTQHLIYVSIALQKLFLYKGGVLEKIYQVSTSRNPPSCIENSLGTPTGLHKIDGKIGAGEKLGTVFKGRIPHGLVCEQPEQERKKNLITTRIMRLRGLQDGVNCGGKVDTYNRFVYIHGTNQEDKLGSPNSHGCVLLSNADVAELFDLVEDNSIVFISEE